MSYNEQVLRRALDESVKLQAHYAELLNMHDGGQRMIFRTTQEWLDRLAALDRARQPEGKG